MNAEATIHCRNICLPVLAAAKTNKLKIVAILIQLIMVRYNLDKRNEPITLPIINRYYCESIKLNCWLVNTLESTYWLM